MSVNNNTGNYSRLRTKRQKTVPVSAQKERNLSIKKVSVILKKDESKRTKEEKELLFNYSEIVKEAANRIERRKKLKERSQEIEDSETVLDAKCKQLAEAVKKSEYLVVYTGAGISTAARIPDYRGTSGIWTLLQQGKDIGSHDLTQAEPTYTHMALSQLHSLGKLKHVVSQNCDGLHLRSGLPKKALSEVHGNMYIEVCRSCRPIVEYLRLFDVTENTARYNHKTYRRCYKCNSPLVDSIVHFGERGNLPWPLNWKGACKAAEKADMILCIGSSLKVLKRYPWLWSMDKPAKRRPQLYIVNLQWTPKDCQATVKINGKCDNVMKKVMKYLCVNVPEYSKDSDPIFVHATPLCKEEKHTTDRPCLINVKTEENHYQEKSIKEEIVEEIEKKPEILNNEAMKEELILITIKSDEEFEVCCSLFKNNQTHHKDCVHFIDEKNDIPIIMQDDVILKDEKLEETVVKNEINESNSSHNSLISNNYSQGMTESQYLNSLINYYQNLAPIYYPLLFPNFGGNFLTNNFYNPYFQNLGLVIPLIQNYNGLVNVDQNVVNLNQDTKRGGGDKAEEIPRKKQKAIGLAAEKEGEENLEGENSLGIGNRIKTNRNVKVSGSSGTKLSPKKLVNNLVSDNLKCSFCRKQYLSNGCLFYPKFEPVFRGNVPTCECCDDEDEEEVLDASDEKANESQKTVANPGWYGKGYKKHFKKKR